MAGYKYKRKAARMASKGKTVKAAASKAKASKPMVSLIRKVATQATRAELETKYVAVQYNDQQFNSGITSGFSEMYSLIPMCQPPTTAGDAAGDWQRANNDITPISVRTHWTFTCSPGEPNRSVNIIGVLYCLQAKSIRHFNDLNTYLAGPSFLKSGNSGQVQQFNGFPGDIMAPINIENFTLLHKKTFHLQKNVGAQNGDTTSASTPNSSPSVFQHSYSLKVPKQYRYSPGSGEIYPQGHAPFWVVGYCHVDGTAPDVLNRDLTASWRTDMTFKDA